MELSKEQQEYLQDALNRGMHFEQMVNGEGWKLLKAYYEARLQTFANNILTTDNKAITEFEHERQRLIGIRQLFTQVNNDIKTLKDEQKKPKPTTTDK